jgi:hypothetical protein
MAIVSGVTKHGLACWQEAITRRRVERHGASTESECTCICPHLGLDDAWEGRDGAAQTGMKGEFLGKLGSKMEQSTLNKR